MNQIGNISTNAASATVVTLIPSVLNDQNNELLINKSNVSLNNNNNNNRKKKIINNILNNESLQFNEQNMLVDQSGLAITSIANGTRTMANNNNNNIIEMPLISEGKI
jgi:hypothetical protein